MYLSKNLRLAYLVLTALLHLCIAGMLFTSDMELQAPQEETAEKHFAAARFAVSFIMPGGFSGPLSASGNQAESGGLDTESDQAADSGVGSVSVRDVKDVCATCGKAAVGTEEVGQNPQTDDTGDGTEPSEAGSQIGPASDEKSGTPEDDSRKTVSSEAYGATLKEPARQDAADRTEAAVRPAPRKETGRDGATSGQKSQRSAGDRKSEKNLIAEKKKSSAVGSSKPADTPKNAGSASSDRSDAGDETGAQAQSAGRHGDGAAAAGHGSSGILELSRVRLLYRPEFVYPASARRFGRQGLVKLVLSVSPSGVVTGVRVEKSSGHSSLDDSAVKYASKFRFASGAGGGFLVRIPVLYQLK